MLSRMTEAENELNDLGESVLPASGLEPKELERHREAWAAQGRQGCGLPELRASGHGGAGRGGRSEGEPLSARL